MHLGRKRWVLLAILATVAVGALCAVSWVVLTYERHTFEAQEFSALERKLEQANWKLDATVAPLLATETARPDDHYTAFFTPDEAVDAEGRPVTGEPLRVPSPLLQRRERFSVLHFTWSIDDGWGSPQLPDTTMRSLAIARGWTDEATLAQDSLHLRSLHDVDAARFLRERLKTPRESEVRGPVSGHVLRSLGEEGAPQLLLARISDEQIQGQWVDWPLLRQRLRNAIDFDEEELTLELLPGELGPLEPGTARLANLPVLMRLTAAPPPPPGWSSTRRVLVLAWVGFLATLGATLVALWTAWELSARRGRFASAVTHELRTPLTTFCMYSQMLADGVVSDPEDRNHYHRTLVRESARLRRVVDNVLTHARIEGRKTGLSLERQQLRGLLDRLLPTLESRALEGGLCFEATDPRTIGEAINLETDGQAVEQILLNLVDNAAKYAGEGEVPEVRIEVAVGDRNVRLVIQDQGPGIPRDIERRLFEPYARSERAVAARAPGVGLGLALARGLARELGGDLRLVPTAVGAAFELRLPRAA